MFFSLIDFQRAVFHPRHESGILAKGNSKGASFWWLGGGKRFFD
jgi:hypothetical protein